MDPGTIAGITIGSLTGIILLSMKGQELHKRRERVRRMARASYPASMLPRYSVAMGKGRRNERDKKTRKQKKNNNNKI